MNIKKSSAVFMLIIFIIGMIPFAVAQKNQDNGKPINIGQDMMEPNASGLDKVRPVPREGMQARTMAEERMGESKGKPPKERLEKARNRFIESKEKYAQLKENYKNVRTNFLSLKNEFKRCSGSNSEECSQKMEQFNDEAKTFMLNAVDVILANLEQLKAKIESAENLSTDEMNEFVSELDEKITEIEAAKSVIENINGSSSPEELREASRTIKNAWQKTKVSIKKQVGHLIGAKIRQIIANSERLYAKFTSISERLQNQGQDTNSLDELLAEYQQNIKNAKEEYQNALEKWKEIKSAEDASDSLREANEFIEKSRDYLKDSRDTLRKIVNEIKNNRLADAEEEEESGNETNSTSE